MLHRCDELLDVIPQSVLMLLQSLVPLDKLLIELVREFRQLVFELLDLVAQLFMRKLLFLSRLVHVRLLLGLFLL